MGGWNIARGPVVKLGLAAVVLLAALAGLTSDEKQQARTSLGAAYDPTTQHGELLVRVDAGPDGATSIQAVAPPTAPNQVLTASDAGVPVWRTPVSSITASQITDSTGTGRAVLTAATAAAARVALETTLYASDCVAANGAGGDATASITGTGSGSTVTLGVSSTSRLCNSSGFAAGSITCTLPAGTRRVALYLAATALSGFSTGGNRYLTSVIRWAGEGAPASVLWGAASKDSNGGTLGDMRSNSNATQHTFSPTNWPLSGTNVWSRIRWDLETPTVTYASAASSVTLPVRWTTANIITQTQAGPSANTMGTVPVGDAAQVSVCLESYGTGGASTGTFKLIIVVGL